VNTVQTVLVVVVVLAVLAGAWWLVRRQHTRSDPKPPPLLGPGWQFYSRPTQLEPPGTVFRIDQSKRRYIVDTLEVATQSGEEAVARREESVTANLGMLARFFGLGPKLDVAADHTETFVFELKGASRQYVGDVDLDTALNPWLARLAPREGSRYYVIREAESGSEIIYHLNRGQVDKLGGEASLSEKAKLEGNLHMSTSKEDYLLQQKFETPMRIMFLPEELRPYSPTREIGKEAVITRSPVTEPLVWVDAEEPERE